MCLKLISRKKLNIKNTIALIISSFLKKRIFVPLLLLVFAGIALLTLVYSGIVKTPLSNVPFFQKELKVAIKTEYKNPFDKKTQYVNPFDTYKNPFVVAK